MRLLIIILLLICNQLFSQELIPDPNFQRGLSVLHPTTGIVQGYVQWTLANDDPVWQCAQWNSKSSLIDVTPNMLLTDWFRWENTHKTVEIGRHGSMNYDILLGINSINEYDSTYRHADTPWPHLLVRARISTPGAIGPGCPPLSEIDSLNFNVSVRLEKASILKTQGYNPQLHAAQFLIYFTVQNLNLSSPGYGSEYIWLGIQIYDDRYQFPNEYINHDPGTSTLIYSIASDSFTSNSVHHGEWVNFKGNLLPYAIKALNEAWNSGYLPSSQNLIDYKIGGMNMGWESPGLNDVQMIVRNLRLTASKAAVSVEVASDKNTSSDLKLYPAFPNPFNPATIISYQLPHAGQVNLEVYNVLGQRVRTLVREFQIGSKNYSYKWDGKDNSDAELASGLYFAVLRTNFISKSIKIFKLN